MCRYTTQAHTCIGTQAPPQSSPLLHPPAPRPLDVPVRAMILPLLDKTAAAALAAALAAHVTPAVPAGGIWAQVGVGWRGGGVCVGGCGGGGSV